MQPKGKKRANPFPLKYKVWNMFLQKVKKIKLYRSYA
jgi:hypothetical protein